MVGNKPTGTRKPKPHGPGSLQSIRKDHIERVLRETGQDLGKAAELLRIKVSELRRWMRRLGVF